MTGLTKRCLPVVLAALLLVGATAAAAPPALYAPPVAAPAPYAIPTGGGGAVVIIVIPGGQSAAPVPNYAPSYLSPLGFAAAAGGPIAAGLYHSAYAPPSNYGPPTGGLSHAPLNYGPPGDSVQDLMNRLRVLETRLDKTDTQMRDIERKLDQMNALLARLVDQIPKAPEAPPKAGPGKQP